MGNQLIKNYDIQKESSGVAGFASLWRIYPGVRQDKTAQGPNCVSVFMLDKKFLDKANKSIREDLMAFLRKEPQSLAKFKQPNCLSIVEPLVEDAKNMAFVTEFIQSTLQNHILTNSVSEIYSTDFEVKMHLLELLQALSFFHNDLKMAHLGVSPENIYVTFNGKWKLGGMVFSTQILNDKKADSANVDFVARTEGVLQMNPNLNFSAPEVCESPSKCCFTSDVFSLGLLIYTIFKIKAEGNTTSSIYCLNVNNLTQYKDKINNVGQALQKEKFFREMPIALKTLLSKMLQIEASLRPTISEILSSAWFNDPFIQTIAHLEVLPQKDVSQQQLFLKGLSKILLKFESKVIKTIIIPSLMDYLKLEQLSPIIIQIIISVLEQNNILTKGEFGEIIWPSIKALTTGKEIPAQSLYLLVANVKILCDFITNTDLQTYLMPLILKCYECGVSKLQELALQNTEFLVKKLDFVFIKTKMLPRVLKLCTDSNADLRRNALFCLSKIHHLFERNTIIEQVIGTLEKIKKMGADAKMNVMILSIYEGISKTIGIEVISTKILPNLVSCLSDLNLSKSEFKSYLSTIQSLLKKIEEERLAGAGETVPSKEEDSDMNKILKEIEDMDKDNKKSANEIFAVMQGPATSNDFDFLSLFETGVVTPAQNEPTVSQDITIVQSNVIEKPLNPPLKEKTTPVIAPPVPRENKAINPGQMESGGQKPVIAQKIDDNFDFFNEIDKPKAKPGLFTQTVQMKKQTTAPSNNDNLFNNMNLNQKPAVSNPPSNLGFGNPVQNNPQKAPAMNQGLNVGISNQFSSGFGNLNTGVAKGNMLNLNYDPFSDIDVKTTSNPGPSLTGMNSNPPVNNSNNNPFSFNSMNQNQNLNKQPTVKPNQPPVNSNNGWNFDDFPSLSTPAQNNLTGMGFTSMKPQPVTQNLGMKQGQTNMNVGGAGAKKLSDNFDFFQNAVPIDQGLKINKVNPTFNKNDDLI